MSDAYDFLHEFHDFYGHDDPALGLELRKELIREEFQELIEALEEGDDLRSVYKELADLIYVCYGLDVHLGGYLDSALFEVHAANMTKLWPCECEDTGLPCDTCSNTRLVVRRREDGKVLKPPSYCPPNLSFIPRKLPKD